MKLKICGIKHPENARQLLTLEPDYLGFIFYKKSLRYVGEPAELEWMKNLPGPARKVGVFVNEAVEKMNEIAEMLGLHVIQLHGDESPEVCEALKTNGLEVWKAFGVDADFDFSTSKPYEGLAGKFLFDTKGINRGGNGVAFDWSLLEKYEGKTPFLLSGGIGPEDAIPVSSLKANKSSLLAAIDINSRFETEPGWKDFNLVKQFKHELFH